MGSENLRAPTVMTSSTLIVSPLVVRGLKSILTSLRCPSAWYVPTTRSLGFQANSRLMDLGFCGSSHPAMSSLFGMNGVSSRRCASGQSRLMVDTSISRFSPRLSSAMLWASSIMASLIASASALCGLRSNNCSFSGVVTSTSNDL